MARSLTYLPMTTGMGSMEDPTSGKHGKSMNRQFMDSIIGRRGAGMSQITRGDPGAHTFNQYSKKGFPKMEGGDL